MRSTTRKSHGCASMPPTRGPMWRCPCFSTSACTICTCATTSGPTPSRDTGTTSAPIWLPHIGDCLEVCLAVLACLSVLLTCPLAQWQSCIGNLKLKARDENPYAIWEEIIIILLLSMDARRRQFWHFLQSLLQVTLSSFALGSRAPLLVTRNLQSPGSRSLWRWSL